VDPFFRNSSLAEQSNALTKLKTAAAHMNQFTLIWRIRWMLQHQQDGLGGPSSEAAPVDNVNLR
jgi:hypothetical protein